ncbi:enoyl-CoA hydratase/isomerase family protein [Rhodococcus opacus]|uniref:enoyl-CoA hydratase/isomerase family protein n=1 Tax=Rhodococcus opacus TaxID=37919 RepID=UPI003D7BAC52
MSDVAKILQSGSTPTVAAVNGPAMGGGAWLALACDIVVAATDFRLGFPELQHSVVPSLVTPSVIAVLGRKLAFDLLSLARVMGPPRCHEHGTTRRCHRASTSPSELSTAPCPGRVRCR